ncbi:zinc finger 827-like [Solea senegalensis]|uniref:Zinc finger 827-like n=1 Tax=Solea senegalensis TaxID=28829 RepID=A0AAV6PF56_SOLSE|nr:zinc finger 827-like [Solea senegalensis]
MKRGSSVLQPPSDVAKRHTHTHTHPAHTHTGAVCGEHTADARAEGSSPFPAATSLFSPDVSTKMASDLLIRLSEATQKVQVHPGSQVEAEPERREAHPEARGGQQDEPGPALSPDGPGASPDPPPLTHTADGNATPDTLASDLLRKLAERQEEHCHGVRVKEEEEPMEVDAVAISDLIHERPLATEMTSFPPKMQSCRLFAIKTEEQSLSSNRTTEHLLPRAKMADRCLLGLKMEDGFFPRGPHVGTEAAVGVNEFHFRVKMEAQDGAKMAEELLSGAKMEDQFLLKTKHLSERPKLGHSKCLSGVKMEEAFPSGAKMADRLLPGTNMADQVFSRVKAEEQLFFGAKMEDQCLRAVLWQDMSVNLASTLLHQLSERVTKSTGQLMERSTPPIRSSPVLKLNVDSLRPPTLVNAHEPVQETQTTVSRDQTTGYFYRCHVCGFETEGRVLFQSHMTEHRQWERGSFSLHCCVCEHSTNQEAEMSVHAHTHVHGDAGVNGDASCPVVTLPPPSLSSSRAPAVAMVTQPETSSSEHRCRICQRSFPGQQELLVHFQGHRQGNQYRCDRCGHLTRTANKLVEHVRVHTGERPFTCDLCPYSAKRRDSLRLHCKVKHANANAGGGGVADAPGDVHTHRSYVHGDNQRSHKHVQRLHTRPHTHTHIAAPSSSSSSSSLPPLHPLLSDRAGWRDLSPLIPITTLISLKPRPLSASSSSSSSSSSKHSFLCYLGLTTS